MINLNFAPNENFHDARLALKVLLNPTNWFKNSESNKQMIVLSELTGVSCEKIFFLLSARGALYLILRALQLPAGSKVFVQGFTCEAVVLPAMAANYKPVYVDIEEKTWSMDISSLGKKYTDKCRVIILQHTFGMTPVFRKKILEFAHHRKIYVIEDVAHGFHPEIFKQDTSGTGAFLFSFGRSKLISSVHGGAIVIKGEVPDLFKKFYHELSFPAWTFTVKALLYKILTPTIRVSFNWKIGKVLHLIAKQLYLFTGEISEREKGGKYDDWLTKRYPYLLAQTLSDNLRNIRSHIAQRIYIAEIYHERLKSPFDKHNLPVIRFPILVYNPQKIKDSLKSSGIVLGDWYDQAVAPKGLDLAKVEYRKGECPVAENLSQKVVNLPTNVSKRQAYDLVEKLREYTHLTQVCNSKRQLS